MGIADIDPAALSVPVGTVAVTVTTKDRVCAPDADSNALAVTAADKDADSVGALLNDPQSDARADAVTETDTAAVADVHGDAVADADVRVLVDARGD